jgi:hypothetical protein
VQNQHHDEVGIAAPRRVRPIPRQRVCPTAGPARAQEVALSESESFAAGDEPPKMPKGGCGGCSRGGMARRLQAGAPPAAPERCSGGS